MGIGGAPHGSVRNVRSRKARLAGMARITESEREARRNQILDAARSCVAEHGLEAVSMEMIIKASGVSIGAVYRYFKGKDEVIAAAFISGTSGMIAALESVWAQEPVPPLPELLGQVLRAIRGYQTAAPIDLAGVALHGWSHSQSDPDLRAGASRLYGELRAKLRQTCRAGQQSGSIDGSIDPDALAQLLFSIVVGFTAQRTLIGDADIDAHVAAFRALAGASTAQRA